MKFEKKLTTKALSMKNIRRKPLRSFVLISFILIFTFVLLMGSLVSISLSNGITSLSNRLGADVMVVPEGHKTEIDSVLLSGEPSEFYLPIDVLDKLKTIEGIDLMSPQTYIATLRASCCSYPLQIIGIDYHTDFIIKPWLTQTLDTDLRDGQVIIGKHVAGEKGDILQFFGKPFKIMGKLEQTGMGFDATVFMTKNTAVKLAVDAERKKKHPLSEDGSLISAVMIKLKPGYDSVEVAREITKKYADEGIYGMFSKKFVNTISSNLSVISTYIGSTIIILWILSVLIISLVFTMIFNERKKEMAILRVLGATKKKLRNMILTEAIILSLIGSSIGTLLALLGVVIVSPTIVETLNIPFLLPSLFDIIKLSILCFVIGLVVGPISSLYTVIKVNKYDIYKNVRED